MKKIFLVLFLLSVAPTINVEAIDITPIFENEDYILLNNVDDPYSSEEIKDMIIASDDHDGDLTDSIYFVVDNYKNNEKFLGDHIIIFGVMDSAEQESTVAITIRNVDINTPEFIVAAESTLHIPQYSHLPSNLPGVKAIDQFEGDITSDIVITGLELIDTEALGNYTLIYQVSDSTGNETIETFVVTVVDSTAPVLDGPFEINKRADYILDGQFYLTYFSATDDHDGIISNRIEVISDEYLGNANAPGTYEIVISVADIQGNYTNHTLKIKVVKEMIPHLIIDKFYFVVPNNHLMTDDDFIETLKFISDLPNYTYIFTTTYDNYTNFYERIDTYQKGFSLISSTGNEYIREIILEVVPSDFNIVEQEPGFIENYGKYVLGGVIAFGLIGLAIFGAIKK